MTSTTNCSPHVVRRLVLAAGCVAAGIGFCAATASAQTLSVDQIIKALQDAPAQSDGGAPGATGESPRNSRKRAFSAKERIETAGRVEPQEAAKSRPSLDLEIYFDFNSAVVTQKATPDLERLGAALVSPALQGSRFMIAGHTDGKGGADFNLALSQRRADAVRQFLVQRFRIDVSRLEAIGHGKNRLKVVDNPLDAANRRVQIVNQGEAVAQLPAAKAKR